MSGRCTLPYVDATTAELAACELPLAALAHELPRIAPREVICAAEQLGDPAAGADPATSQRGKCFRISVLS